MSSEFRRSDISHVFTPLLAHGFDARFQVVKAYIRIHVYTKLFRVFVINDIGND